MTAIRVELELDDGTFTTRMLHAGQTVEQFERTVKGTISSIKAVDETSRSFMLSLRDMTIVLGLAGAAINAVRSVTTGWIGDIVRVNAEFERMTIILKGMSNATDPLKEAREQVKFIRDYAKDAPYSITALTDTFVKLKSTGIDPAKGTMKGLIDAVSAFGGSEEILKRVSIAVQQMSGKGVIQMEELRQQLGEAIPRATELMARSMGTTVGELVKAISTGTVQSKPALELLQREFERTFGGAARERMNTFDGMVTRLKTNLQDLSVKVGEAQTVSADGKSKTFFDAIKDQIGTINEFLSGKQAERLATSLGRGLGSMLNGINSVIARLSYFKDEIVAIGQVIAVTFVASKGLSAALALGAGFATAASHARIFYESMASLPARYAQVQAASAGASIGVTAFGAAFSSTAAVVGSFARGLATLALEFFRFPIHVATFVTSLAMGQVSMSGFVAGLAVARTAIAATASALVALAPWLALIGIGITAAASYFDLFGKKTKDAREEIEKFGGAASRESMKLLFNDIQRQKKELQDLETERKKLSQAAVPLTPYGPGQAGLSRMDDDIVGRREKIAKDEQMLIKAGTEYALDDARRRADGELKILDEKAQNIQRLADLNGKRMADEQEVALEAAKKTNRSTDDLKADYAKRERERQLGQHNSVIKLYEEQYAILNDLVDKQDGVQREITERQLQGIIRVITEQKKQRDELAALPIGIPTGTKGIDEDKLYKKGTDALEKLRASIAGTRAELAGANGDVVELQTALNAGKYGPIDSGRVKELISDLVKAQEEKSRLDELLEGKNKFERDGLNIILDLEQKIFEARTRGMSVVDKYKLKIQEGFYPGIGPGSSPTEQKITNINTGLEAATTAANTMKTALDRAFSVTDGTLLSSLYKITEAIKGITGAVQNIVPSGFSVANVGSGVGNGRFSLSGIQGGGSYLDNLIGKESSGNPNAEAKTSSAVGLGQFIKSTWLAFLGAMHPDLLNEGALELRKNVGLMKDAILWYARENAKRLEAANIPANDANVYLAHFLGPGGAIAALSKSIETPLASIPELAGALKSNAFLQGKSVGWLQSWAEQKFGTGTTFKGGEAKGSGYTPTYQNDSRRPMPDKLTPEQLATVGYMEKLDQSLNKLNADNALSDKMKDIRLAIEAASEQADGFGKRISAVRKLIKDGEFGPDKDPDSQRYKELIKLAGEWDAAEKKAQQNKQLRQKVDTFKQSRERENETLGEREEDLARRFKNESTAKLSDGYYRQQAKLEKDNQTLHKAADAGVISQDELDRLLQENASTLKRYRDLEVGDTIQAEQKKTREIERGLMTADQAREASFQEEVKHLQDLLALSSATGEQRAQLEKVIQDKIRVYRAQTSASSPIAKQMKDWADVGNNLQKSMTGWLDSATDQLATFITTGKADFKSLADSILKDISRLAIRWALSGLAGNLGLTGGGGKSKAIGAAHTGAIVGQGFSMSRMANTMSFAGAPRFHQGGIIGVDEVPIIAKRKEGVFTPEQMKALGDGTMGSQQMISIAPSITLNASGGSPEQNHDLAKQFSRQIENSMRQIVNEELRTQMRPGGTLSR